MALAKCLFYSIFLLISTTALVAQGSTSPFIGTFSGQGITLQLQASTDGYSGQVSQAGESFPVVAANFGDNMIVGTYQYYGQTIAFTAQVAGQQLTIVSEGQAILLQRQAAQSAGTTAANPAPIVKPNQPLQNEKPAAAAVGAETYDKTWGMRFKAPDKWRVLKNDGLYLLGSDTKHGFILVLPHEAKSRAELLAGAREGLVEEGGTQLLLDGEPRNYGDSGVAANFKGLVEGQQAKAFSVAILSPHGTGAIVMTAVEPGSYSAQYEKDVKSLVASIKFSKPIVPDFVGEWQRDLRGAKLTYMWSYYSSGFDGSYTGGSSKKVIDLCPQGYFYYSSSDNISVDAGGGTGAYGGGQNAGNGSWVVNSRGNKPLLQLKFNDGRVFEYELEYKEKKTYLNGERYFWTKVEAGVCN